MCYDELLEKVSLIIKDYDKNAKSTGENFNIFKILGKERNESSHSKFLTNLLNPEGTHDCGDIFLKLFFKHFLSDKYDPDFRHCYVYREHSTKYYGRPDIYIKCGDVRVVIENKIDADDVEKQLEQYSDFLNGENDGLLYLTLDGRKASPKSRGNVNYYRRLAYGPPKTVDDPDDNKNGVEDKSYLVEKSNIINWLECCQKQEEVSNKLLVRETIAQYITLLKIITNQTRSNRMSKEIIGKIIDNPKNLRAAIEISNNLLDAKKELIKSHFVDLMSKVEKESGGFVIDPDPRCNDIVDHCFGQYCGISFKKPEWKRFTIKFEFQNTYLKNLKYGLYNPDPNNVDWKKYLPGLSHRHYESADWWPLSRFMDNEYRNWDDDFFLELCSGRDSIVNVFVRKIKDISEIVENEEYQL